MSKAMLGGILSITAGAFGVLRLGLELFNRYLFGAFSSMNPSTSSSTVFSSAFMQFSLVLSLIWGVIAAITGILAIIGGLLALKKKSWGLAFAGAIAGTVAFFPCGVPAIIFLVLSKDEFSTKYHG